MSIWQIQSSETHRPGTRGDAAAADTLPLKWAHDAQTGVPRYIHDPEVVGRECTCTCPACRLQLTPVMAGHPLRVRPTAHFRHPPGAMKNDCSLVAARLAATRHLLDLGVIELPLRRMSRTALGFSGAGYEVWVEVPTERISVVRAALLDHATALLTLDDGRKLLVDLTGQREPGSDGVGRAVVTMSLSDPAIAMLSPEDIRSRLRILPDIRWCAHWNDHALAAEGDAAAEKAVREGLDGWQDTDEATFRALLPPEVDAMSAQSLRRETLLHRQVKTILENASSIATPGLEVSVTRDPPDEFGGDWEDHTILKSWMTASRTLELGEVQLERRLGGIVPDVIATLGGQSMFIRGGTATWISGDFEEDIEDNYSSAWPPTLLIEVTVTHGIDEEKLRRIRELDIPTLEIDVGSLGGRVTLEGLRNLVVNETIGKRWVHHPIFRIKKRLLNESIDNHPVTVSYRERLAELRRPHQLAIPAQEWATRYLAAVTDFHDTNTDIKKARRAHRGPDAKPSILGKDNEPWSRIMEAAEALAAHDLPGANDPVMLDETGLVARILSIQNNRGVGYAVNTGFQVLNSIMQSGVDNKRWDTLYTMAVKAYGLEVRFTPKQANLYAAWRQTIIDQVAAGNEAYLRTRTYDAVLSVIFPEMAPRIGTGYGRAVEPN